MIKIFYSLILALAAPLAYSAIDLGSSDNKFQDMESTNFGNPLFFSSSDL